MEDGTTTLVGLLSRSASNWADRPAVIMHGSSGWEWTYGELWGAARSIANHLQQSGIAKGDRVILWAPNRPEWVAAFFGTLLVGAVAVPLDVRSREDLLTEIEEQTLPQHAFFGRAQAAELTGKHVNFTILDELRGGILSGPSPEIDPNIVAPDDIAELVFTSGTTGNPKGVILTHRNIVANVHMSRPAFPPTPSSRVLSILPLSHMFEQVGGLLVPMSGGASMTYVSSLRPDVIFAAMVSQGITNMTCVPQVLGLFREASSGGAQAGPSRPVRASPLR